MRPRPGVRACAPRGRTLLATIWTGLEGLPDKQDVELLNTELQCFFVGWHEDVNAIPLYATSCILRPVHPETIDVHPGA